MKNTADLKEHRISKYMRAAEVAAQRISDDGLGEVRVYGFPIEDERVVRTALRREATSRGIPVKVQHSQHTLLFMTRTDLDYEGDETTCADPRFVVNEISVRDAYSKDPARIARNERIKALRFVDVRDFS